MDESAEEMLAAISSCTQNLLPICLSVLVYGFFAAYAQSLMGRLLINKFASDTCQHVWEWMQGCHAHIISSSSAAVL